MYAAIVSIILYMHINALTYGSHVHTAIQCRRCNSVRNPTECMTFHSCGESCKTTVTKDGGEYIYRYDCVTNDHCKGIKHGRRRNHENEVCVECCSTSNCDLHTCSSFFTPNQTSTGTSTNTITSNQPTVAAMTRSIQTTTASASFFTPNQTSTGTSTNTMTSNQQSVTTKTRSIQTTTASVSLTPKDCNNLDVLEGLAKGFSVSHPGTLPCPDGVHQPSWALLQEYCGAPYQRTWLPGKNVMDNCARIPRFSAVAASTVSFGVDMVAGVFLNCEPMGFKMAAQTCETELSLYYVTRNTTKQIPSADKFVLLNW